MTHEIHVLDSQHSLRILFCRFNFTSKTYGCLKILKTITSYSKQYNLKKINITQTKCENPSNTERNVKRPRPSEAFYTGNFVEKPRLTTSLTPSLSTRKWNGQDYC